MSLCFLINLANLKEKTIVKICNKKHQINIPKTKEFLLIIQVALILWIRWPFSERKFNMTTISNYFNLDFKCGVCVKILSLLCVAKTDVVVYSLLMEYPHVFLRICTLYFLIFFSQLYIPVHFWSNV
jgi:hypothetical protein